MSKPIIVQGAMKMEVERLLENLKNMEEIKIGNHVFYKGQMSNYPVIVSKTNVGMVDATIATTLGIIKFNPLCVINQGLAGSHKEDIHRGDIIIGNEAAHINSFITDIKKEGEGSNPFDWKFDKRGEVKYRADEQLIKIVKDVEREDGNIIFGTIGSGNIFNREFDRIQWIHNMQNTLCEDNETVAIYSVCKEFNVPCIGVRIIGNNEKTGTKEDGGTATRKNDGVTMITREYDEKPAYIVQRFVIKVINHIIKNANRI